MEMFSNCVELTNGTSIVLTSLCGQLLRTVILMVLFFLNVNQSVIFSSALIYIQPPLIVLNRNAVFVSVISISDIVIFEDIYIF